MCALLNTFIKKRRDTENTVLILQNYARRGFGDVFDVLQHTFLRRRRDDRDLFEERDKSTHTALLLLALLLRVLFEANKRSSFGGALRVLNLVHHFRLLELFRTHGAHTLARYAFCLS